MLKNQQEVPDRKILVSKRDAANALSLSIRTIENLIARKDGLKVIRCGRRTLITWASLEAFARRDHASPSKHANGDRLPTAEGEVTPREKEQRP